jgi:hypothetical protein
MFTYMPLAAHRLHTGRPVAPRLLAYRIRYHVGGLFLRLSNSHSGIVVEVNIVDRQLSALPASRTEKSQIG